MRKLLKWILVPVLVLALAGTASAEGNVLKIRDVTAQKEETVYVTVELTESVVGDSVGISYTYDEKSLTLVAESCSWVRKGVLQDFDAKNHIGVWTVSQSEDLKGGVCVLAFAVNKRANFTKTEVTCTATVKDSGQTVGVYTAAGKVIMDCTHTYGQWTDGGDMGHTRTCSLCQGAQTQSHQWNEGIVTNDPSSGANVITYTCQICGGTKTIETSQQATVPTLPEYNEPTISQTEPDNAGQNNSGDGHDHTSDNENGDHNELFQEETVSTVPPVETQGQDYNHEGDTTQEVDPYAGHNHTQTAQGGNPWITVGIICLVIAAFLGISIYWVKKK